MNFTRRLRARPRERRRVLDRYERRRGLDRYERRRGLDRANPQLLRSAPVCVNPLTLGRPVPIFSASVRFWG